MLLLASLLAVLAAAQTKKGKQCLSTALGSSLVATFEACDLNTQIQTCEKALETCMATSNGGRPSAAIVFHENGDVGFPFVAANPARAYDELIALAVKNFDVDEDHTVHFNYAYEQDGIDVNFVVKDDESLRTALGLAKAWDFRLQLHAMRMTLEPTTSPTPTPTEALLRQPWVLQKSGTNIADGRESGTVNMRTFTFKKRGDANVGLRVLYNDVLRVIGNGHRCNWEVMFDDKSCPSGRISGTLHTHVNEDDHEPCTISGVCRGLAEGSHTMKINLQSTGGSDCYTGWVPNGGVFLMELFELDATLAPMITYLDKVGPEDGRDTSWINERVLNFKKKEDSSALRIFYSDNFRVYQGGWCKWEVYIDGKICPSHRINAALHTKSGDNDHTPKAILGYCQNIKAGDHQMKIHLQRSGGMDCYTGWGWPAADNFHMEVEEVREDDKRRTWIQKFEARGDDTGYVSSRELTFNKLSEDSYMRFMYNDILRTHGHGVWCRWEIMIDNKKCPDAYLAHAIYTTDHDDDHHPGTIVGYCDNLSKGTHTMRIFLSNSGGVDCYTGWDPEGTGNFVMEAEEIGRSA